MGIFYYRSCRHHEPVPPTFERARLSSSVVSHAHSRATPPLNHVHQWKCSLTWGWSTVHLSNTSQGKQLHCTPQYLNTIGSEANQETFNLKDLFSVVTFVWRKIWIFLYLLLANYAYKGNKAYNRRWYARKSSYVNRNQYLLRIIKTRRMYDRSFLGEVACWSGECSSGAELQALEDYLGILQITMLASQQKKNYSFLGAEKNLN